MSQQTLPVQHQPAHFLVGDNVRLKAGGPVMTVQSRVEQLVLCVWMDETGRVHRQTFSPRELEAPPDQQMIWVRALARLSARWKAAANR